MAKLVVPQKIDLKEEKVSSEVKSNKRLSNLDKKKKIEEMANQNKQGMKNLLETWMRVGKK